MLLGYVWQGMVWLMTNKPGSSVWPQAIKPCKALNMIAHDSPSIDLILTAQTPFQLSLEANLHPGDIKEVKIWLPTLEGKTPLPPLCCWIVHLL